MIQNLTQSLIRAIQANGTQSVFLGAIIEQLAGVLVPSPIIPMSAGFLLITKDLLVVKAIWQICQKVALPYTLGAVWGTLLFYLGAFWGGRAMVAKFGKIIGVSLPQIDRFRARFSRGLKDEISIFFLLILPVTSVSLVSATCGLIGIPFFEFLPIFMAGIFLRAVFLAWLGWQTGETFTLLAAGIDRIESILSLILVVLVFGFLAFGYYKRSQYSK